MLRCLLFGAFWGASVHCPLTTPCRVDWLQARGIPGDRLYQADLCVSIWFSKELEITYKVPEIHAHIAHVPAVDSKFDFLEEFAALPIFLSQHLLAPQVTDVDPSLQPDQLRIEPYHIQQYLGQPQWNQYLWTFTKARKTPLILGFCLLR